MSRAKLYKLTNSSLNLFLLAVLSYALYVALGKRSENIDWAVIHIDQSLVIYSALTILLMVVNWSLEGIKWTALIKKIHSLNKREVAGSLLIGLSVNFIAPNRTGDFFGRLVYIPKSKRYEASYLNFFSAASQLMVTFIGGLISIIALSHSLEFFPKNYNSIVVGSAILIALISVLLYFNSNIIFKLFNYFKSKNRNEFISLGFKSKLFTLLVSAFRYLIFLVQFYFILGILGSDLSFVDSSLALALIYFVNSFIPSNFFVEVLARGSIAAFVFQFLGFDLVLGLFAISLLWLINLCIPALAGMYFIKDIKWMDSSKLSSKQC